MLLRTALVTRIFVKRIDYDGCGGHADKSGGLYSVLATRPRTGRHVDTIAAMAAHIRQEAHAVILLRSSGSVPQQRAAAQAPSGRSTDQDGHRRMRLISATRSPWGSQRPILILPCIWAPLTRAVSNMSQSGLRAAVARANVTALRPIRRGAREHTTRCPIRPVRPSQGPASRCVCWELEGQRHGAGTQPAVSEWPRPDGPGERVSRRLVTRLLRCRSRRRELPDTVRAAARRPDSESRCYECVSSNPRTLASEAKR